MSHPDIQPRMPSLQAVPIQLDQIIGGQFVGTLLMVLIQGFNVAQQIQYHNIFQSPRLSIHPDAPRTLSSTSGPNSPIIRIIVHTGCVISFYQTIILCYWEYKVFVESFSDLSGLVKHDWILNSQFVTNGVILALAQSVYASRLCKLHASPLPLTIFFALIISSGFGLSIACTISVGRMPYSSAWWELNWTEIVKWDKGSKKLFVTCFVKTIFVDACIFIGMIWTLMRQSTKANARAETMLSRLTMLMAESMALPFVCVALNLMALLVFGSPVNSNTRVFGYIQSKVSIGAVLWLLTNHANPWRQWEESVFEPAMPTVCKATSVSHEESPEEGRAQNAERDKMGTSGVGGDGRVMFRPGHSHEPSITSDGAEEKDYAARRKWRTTKQEDNLLQLRPVHTVTWGPPREWTERVPRSAEHRPRTRHLSIDGMNRNGPPSPYYVPQASTSSDPFDRHSGPPLVTFLAAKETFRLHGT